VVNHYFVAVMLPQDGPWIRTVLSRSVTETDLSRARGRWPVGSVPKESQRHDLAQLNAGAALNTASKRLEPKAEVALTYRVIAAPKEDRILEGYDAGRIFLLRAESGHRGLQIPANLFRQALNSCAYVCSP
jgi:hypothetical protein